MVKFNILFIVLISYAFSPKIGLNNSFIYLQDILLYSYIGFFVLLGKIETKYLKIIFIVWFLQMYLFVSFLFTKEIIHLQYFKQLLIFNLLLVPTKYITENINTKKIILAWIIIGVANLFLIIFTFFQEHPSFITYLFDYSPKYRIMGMTGTGIDLLNGVFRSSFNGKEVGTTSISTSILYGLIFLYLCIYKANNKIIVFIIFFIIIFTFSRAGMLILFFSIFAIYTLPREKRIRYISNNFIVFISIIILMILTIYGLVLINKFDFSNPDTFITASKRLVLWSAILDFFQLNPEQLTFGLVLSPKNALNIMNYSYGESLFFDVFLNYGLIGLIAFLLILVIMWSQLYANTNTKNVEKYTLLLFMPGLTAVNLMAGSSLLTDFMLPLILIMFVKGTSNG